ncbi:hypothetical protein HT031_004495 [Scenedesmus sp. PABB004]|nr:hypothetical protein HT031_004495 [Scenedesmus sp. PABB004]
MESPGNLVMLPRDAPTDVLNELQLVADFYGADSPADHQRVMALFAPNAQLDLPQMFVSGREAISAVMFYAKRFVADIDIEPYMVEVAVPGAGGGGHGHHHTATSTAPTSSTTSTDSTSSTCTSAATSRRRRPGGGKPPKAPSAGASNAAATAAAAAAAAAAGGARSRLGRGKHAGNHLGSVSDVAPRGRSRGAASDQTADQFDGTAQNGSGRAAVPASMSRTHVYAVATVTPKSLPRLLTLNLLPREIRVRTRVTLVWDDEAGEVLLLQERPDNLPVGLVPAALKRAVGRALGYVSTRSQWVIGRVSASRLVAARWPGLQRLHGTGLQAARETMLARALLALALALGAAAAQRSSCPSTKCVAYYEYAKVDCCKHDYGADAKCFWGSTPVSWRRVRTCQDAAVAYDVLVQSNFQGPPTNTECRCEGPSVSGGGGGSTPAFAPVSMTVELKPKSDMDIPGNDIACNGASFCKVCGSLDAVKSACASRGRCVAFTWDVAGKCGYLKAAGSLAGKRGWVAFTRE